MRDAPRYTVRELSDRGLLRVEDGNHGEYRPRKHEFVDSGVAFIRAADLSEAGIHFESASKIGEVAVARITKGIGQPRDVILSHKGTVGKVSIAPKDAPSFVCSPQTTFWRSLDNDVLDQNFLYTFIRSPDFKAQLESRAGETDMAGYVSLTAQRTFWVPLPSIEDQKAIVSCISPIDRKIELNRQMNETLESLARAIFKDWFVDFGPTRAKAEGRAPYLAREIWDLFPDALDDEDKPVGWEQRTLADIADSPRRGISPADVAEDTPYIGLEHMPRRSIALSEWEGAGKVTSNKSVFKKGEFLFGKLRPYFHKVGFAPLDGICSTDIVVVVPQGPEWGAFTLACLSSDEFVDYTDQTSTGTKMPRTSWSTMGQYKVCLPSEQLVQAFQIKVQPLLDLVRANIHEARTLAQTRDLLLPRLMSGEIRLAEAEKTVEAVA
jgi:type I restriction enzyme, S subunit